MLISRQRLSVVRRVRDGQHGGHKVRSVRAPSNHCRHNFFSSHLLYAPAGFLSTDVISREINGNLGRHSHTREHMNKHTYNLSCIPIHTQTASPPDANPECVWEGTRAAVRRAVARRRGERMGKEERRGEKVGGREGGGRSWVLFNLSRSVDRAESSASWIGG